MTTDLLTRFLIQRAGVRGVHVRLRETWRQIRARADNPQAAVTLLGEAAAASALFTGHAKVDGRLSVQLRGHGALRMLFAECTAAGTLRGIAQMADVDDADAALTRDLRSIGDDAVLAITIENPSADGREPVRYQGMVSLEADTLSAAFEAYFRQSEQLPTRLLLVADDTSVAGLLLQKLPGDDGDTDGWTRVGALFDTLKTEELLNLDAGTLLLRLFHEDGVEVVGTRPLAFGCSCSQERVESMLASLGPDEARAAVEPDGTAKVRCEFCGQRYAFTGGEIEHLLARAASELAAPGRVQ